MAYNSLANEVLGITNRNDFLSSAHNALGVLTGRDYDHFTLIDTLRDSLDHDPDKFDVLAEDFDAKYAVSFLGEVMLRGQLVRANTLTDWPVYSSMIERYGSKADGNATALMIGALDSISARSFECLAREIYGAD